MVPAGVARETVALMHKIAESLRRRRTLKAPVVSPLDGQVVIFHQVTAEFTAFMRAAVATEPETATIVERLCEMATALAAGPSPVTSSAWFTC